MTSEKKKKEQDITFFHTGLFEVPEDGSPPFLKGYKCNKCGELDFPKIGQCSKCWGKEFSMVPLSRRGKLYSVSDIYIGQSGMAVPYVIGYVDLPEDIRVFAQMDGNVGTFRCNDEVEVVSGCIKNNRDGLPITSYKFKKVEA
ncbi:MAG: OB-fold domain-containing protein [Desulfatirhabdiaceae bacterium]